MPRIQIEDKHTYVSVNTPIYGGRVDGSTYASSNINDRTIIYALEPTYPVTGTDESNRIGRKIYSSSLCSEGFIKLYNTIDNNNINTMYDVYTFHNSDEYTKAASQTTPQQQPFNTNEQALDVSIRHMFVQFDDTKDLSANELKEYLWNWFTQLYIQTGNYNVTSNRTQMLRESTRFTGQFKILYDKVHHLTLQNPIVHYKEVIPYKKQLNFDGTGAGRPTNKMILELFIGPTNIFTDYGSFGLGQWISNQANQLSPNIYVAELSTTLKFKYTDM